MTINETLEYRALRRLAAGSVSNQRTMAESLGVGLVKANHVVRSLVARDLVTVENERVNLSRVRYPYCLTPKGVVEKTTLTRRFLTRKIDKYDRL
jgi:hypothetical protein